MDGYRLDGLDRVYLLPGGWRKLSRFCYVSEGWNGWGYRARGLPSPYVFGATYAQRPGKYPRDHYFDPNLWDPQLGTLALVEELVSLDPSLKFYDDQIEKVEAPSIVPTVDPHPVMGYGNMEWVQRALNSLHARGTPLLVDGNVGRATRTAVWYYQSTHRLIVDGVPGPKTIAALKVSLAQAGIA
jgi:peptidoglycan hydrolase-like protein with peptidoglycan-binding domain